MALSERTPTAASTVPRPLGEADFSRVLAILTDVDGTLTTRDRLESATLAQLERVARSGRKLVFVSGRPAGFGECWMRELPIDAAIVENGGLWFVREDGRIRKRYYQPEAERLSARARLEAEVERVRRRVPGARLSADSAYAEVDLAIDHHEDVRLEEGAATRIEELLRSRGVNAVRSSVHVNCWVGEFDKLRAARRLFAESFGLKLGARDPRVVYVGDSFNDAPMFEAFSLSVGVGNVRDILDRLPHPPRFITRRRQGAGWREAVRAVLQARAR